MGRVWQRVEQFDGNGGWIGYSEKGRLLVGETDVARSRRGLLDGQNAPRSPYRWFPE